MQFVLLIYQPEGFDPKTLPPEEHAAIGRQYGAVTATPGVSPGPPLGTAAQAITVRVTDGVIFTDRSPYRGVAGAVGGFLVFEAEDEAAAIALAAQVPAARLGGAVEVRPCAVYW